MPCPYAAALSDDEDASHHGPHHRDHDDHPRSSASFQTTPPIPAIALTAARSKCPAFSNNACPFRAAGSDPDSLREVMRTVPPSHFPTSSNALQKMIAGGNNNNGNEGEKSSAVTPFQLAMEHVHRVSSLLERDQGQKRNNHTSKDNDEDQPTDRDSFIIKGGCPFKSFHRDHPNGESNVSNSSKNLVRAMEDFSISAIMGRMAEESFVDFEMDDEEEAEQFLEKGKSDENYTTAEEPAIPDTESGEQDQADMSPTQQQQQQQQQQQSPSKTETQSSLLSQALKTGTTESHTAAENVHFVNNFIQGKIDRDLYTELLSGLYHTYVTMERLLDLHAPTHFPTLHFPNELSRLEALRDDMEYWHGSDWERKPECRIPTPAVKDYCDRMEEVGRIDPLLLLSHAYTRYLGDLSGGKVLARIARRALDLGKGHDGLQFYNFERVRSAKLFKDEYRDALDGLVLDADRVGRLVAEANVAFALNMRVFEELDVKGGVPGARVRNVREALSYYDVEVDRQSRRGRDRSESFSARSEEEEEEEAKCPFGFAGGANPHGASARGGKKAHPPNGFEPEKLRDAPSNAILPSGAGLSEGQVSLEKGGRCPWPFVFLHDPVTGMRDWQTWIAIGLTMCFIWSRIHVDGAFDSTEPDEVVVDGATTLQASVLPGGDNYEKLSDLDWFME